MKEYDEIEFYLEDLASRFPKNRNEYYLSYSGGRDSHFLYWFIKEYLHDNEIEIVAINTRMEHIEIMKRMYKYADKVLIPKIKPFEIKERYGSPCFSKEQDQIIDRYQRGIRSESTMQRVLGRDKDGKKYTKHVLSKTARELLLDGKIDFRISDKCCVNLKKKVAHKYEKESGRKKILAIRGSESNLRKQQYTTCFSKNGAFHPLYDLTDEMLREIEKRYNIEVPKIYDHVCRTGCAGCPYGSYKHDLEEELLLVTDNQFKFLCEYFKESYKLLKIDVKGIEFLRKNKQLKMDI